MFDINRISTHRLQIIRWTLDLREVTGYKLMQESSLYIYAFSTKHKLCTCANLRSFFSQVGRQRLHHNRDKVSPSWAEYVLTRWCHRAGMIGSCHAAVTHRILSRSASNPLASSTQFCPCILSSLFKAASYATPPQPDAVQTTMEKLDLGHLITMLPGPSLVTSSFLFVRSFFAASCHAMSISNPRKSHPQMLKSLIKPSTVPFFSLCNF